MNSNALVGLVLKNPEIHAQPPLSSPCQNDANRNKSDRPHATAKSSDTVMASSVKPPFQSDGQREIVPRSLERLAMAALVAAAAENPALAHDPTVTIAGFRGTGVQRAKCVHN